MAKKTWIETAVNAIQKAGSEPATAANIRASLATYTIPATRGAQSPSHE